jgi:hypothetical protein
MWLLYGNTELSGQTFQGNVESFLFQAFYTTPKILLGVYRDSGTERKDVMSFWAEDVTEIHFRVCLREMVSFSGTHDNLYLVSVSSSLSFFNQHINIRWFCIEHALSGVFILSFIIRSISWIDNDHVLSVHGYNDMPSP